MHISSLELMNFRNYSNLKLNFNKGLNIFTGQNAQGKTNIIEALYFLSGLKSHRTSHDKELVMWNKERAYAACYAEKAYTSCKIEALVNMQGRNAFKLNGVKVNKPSDVLGIVNAVIFSPEDLRLVKDGPNLRRKFIDSELTQLKPNYNHSLAQYGRIMAQRNNILKFNKNTESMKMTLEVFGEQLANYGSYICFERSLFIKKLSLIARLIHRKITEGNEELEVLYNCSIGDFKDKEDIKQKLSLSYNENMDEDIKRGFTTFGPHRDDLIIKINGVDARAFGSQGQQRTAALSLKLSELEIIKSEIGEYPILLLDDVLSELDSKRQVFLLNALKEVQTFLTCTSLADLEPLDFNESNVFTVESGVVNGVKL